MINKMFVLFVLFFHLVSCANPKKSNFAKKETVTNYANEQRIDRYANLNDTVLMSNNGFLIYQYVSMNLFQVQWGNAKNDIIYCDTLPIFPNGLPLFEWHNEVAICLEQGCGTDCYFAYILLFKTGKIKKYMYPLAYDTVNNLVACAGDYELKKLAVVENFLTGKKQEIIEDYIPCSHSGNAIDSITFNQSGLFVKWQDNNGEKREKVFK
jgi:hypothetical protein